MAQWDKGARLALKKRRYVDIRYPIAGIMPRIRVT